jgi:glycosyltransferase involved in cell wall biosynthesis
MADVEKVRGVTIHRVATAASGPHGLARRAVAYAQYFLGARRALRELVGPGDIVVAKTDPPMLSAALGSIAKARGAKLAVWLQDLFPEVALEYGVAGMRGPAGAWLTARRNHSLAIADAVVAIGDRMAERLASMECVAPEKLHVIPNWADGDALKPKVEASAAQKRRWGLEDRFVVGYSGNLGRVHEFDTFLGAASRLRGREEIVFLVVGRGPRLAEVKQRVAREQLGNVRFEEHQPRDSLAASLAVPDVHVSILPARFEGLVLPSKLYGIMAVARPTIFIGDANGDTAVVLAESRAGVTIPVGDVAGLVDAIASMRDDPSRVLELGLNARRAFEARFDMPIALAKWRAVLEELGGYTPPTIRAQE